MKKQIIGYAAGVFDLFHIGHLNILRNAKGMCDKLIIAVSTDELVKNYKDKTTIIPFHERADIVRHIRFVDLVVAQADMNKLEAHDRYKFDVMFVGDDWYLSDKWNEIERKLQNLGVKIVYFPYTQGTSSTIINQLLQDKRKEILEKECSESNQQLSPTNL